MATFKVTIEIGTPDQNRFEKLEAVDLKKVSVKNDVDGRRLSLLNLEMTQDTLLWQ